MIADTVIKALEIPPVGESQGDYIDSASGLLMCGRCHTPKQGKYMFMGKEIRPNCLCKCESERLKAEEERRQAEERMKEIAGLKSAGLHDSAFYNYTFDKCDSTHPNRNYAEKYVMNFQSFKAKGEGLLFWGEVGTGKTFMAACIANALLEQNIPVLMTSFPKIFNALGGLYNEDRNAYLRSLNRYSLLIIDDLGVERDTAYALEILYLVTDERYKSGLPMIVTTNLTIDQLNNPADVEHARIYDRITEKCTPILFKGRNYRAELKAERNRETAKILKS